MKTESIKKINFRLVIFILLLCFNIVFGNNGFVLREFIDEYLVEFRAKPISQYDAMLKVEVRRLGWDWRMMASIVWNESRFNIDAVSSRGAMGLMQFMPRTAKRFGLEGEDLKNPKKNIEAGVE